MLPDFKNCRAVVVGDVMLDEYHMGQVRRLSPEAPVPVVNVNKKSATLGGAGNTALNLVGLGCPTTLIGVRGDDTAGERLTQLLTKYGIEDRLVTIVNHPTTTKTRVLGQGQQLLRLDEEKMWAGSLTQQSTLIENFEQALPGTVALILSDYGKGVLSESICKALIGICRKKKIPIFVDPKGTDWERYQHVTCVTPNVAELAAVAGTCVLESDETLIRSAQAICKQYRLERLLITRGADGMCLSGESDEPLLISTSVQEVYDVTGAGDTVIATLAAGIGVGLAFPIATRIANTAAGIVVGKLGAQAITRTELEAAVEKEQAGTGKTVTVDTACMQVKAWQALGRKVTFTNGCFDLLHPGHLHILNRARETGDHLVVGLNTDASIKRIKGPKRPIVTEQDRAAVLSALSCVDLVVLFDEDTPIKLIDAIRPNVLAKGADYAIDEVVGHQIVQSYKGVIRLIPLLEGYSTTGIVDRVRRTTV